MLSSVPWYGFITVSLANHLLKDIWVVSRLYTIQIKLLQTFLYKSLCEHKFSFIWDKCPGVPLLCHMVVTCLTFSETAELFSRVAYHFTFPSVICEWSILSILASIWCVQVSIENHSSYPKPTFTTLIPHSYSVSALLLGAGSSIQWNNARKGNERHTDQKGGNKTICRWNDRLRRKYQKSTHKES